MSARSAKARRAIVSASNFWRRAYCPGSYRCESAAPKIPAGEAAEFGTRMHKLMERPIDDAPEEHRETLEWAHARVADVWREWIPGMFRESTVHRELVVRDESGSYLGRLDWCAISRSRGLVADYKFGRKPAEEGEAESNHQLALYAVGLWNYMPGLQEIAGVLIYPMLRRVTPMVTFGRKELDATRRLYEATVTRCADENAPTKDGDWCKYCAGPAGGCPSAWRSMEEILASL